MTKGRPRLKVLVPIVVLGLLGLLALIGALAGTVHRLPSGGLGSSSGSSGGSSTQTLRSAETKQADTYGPAAGMKAEAPGSTGLAADIPPAAAPAAHYLVRNGQLSLVVARHALVPAVDRITTLTQGLGGYVVSSSVGSDVPVPVTTAVPQPLDGGDVPAVTTPTQAPAEVGDHPYGALTVRVPERWFNVAIARFSKLGEVESVTTSSEDVTSQYVDLRARLEHFRAVERRLVRFLAATQTVSEMLAVQDRIDKVQLTIEELTAQLKSLHETTSYGTLSIALREKGTPAPASVGGSSTFTGTFWHSVVLIARGARITGLVAMALLPFAALFGGIAAAVWYVRRTVRARRRLRQTAPPSLPA